MKALLTFALIVMGVALLAVSTRPSDNECLAKATYSITGTGIVGQLVSATGVADYALRVDDHFFFKTIVSRIDGTTVGYGMFGTVVTP